jgi:hypothetical protein
MCASEAFALGSQPNHLPGAWPVPRGIRGVRPLADAISIGGAPCLRRRGSAATLAGCHTVLGHSPRVLLGFDPNAGGRPVQAGVQARSR